jgi:hypothetical protein
MSALGQKHTRAVHEARSALCHKRTLARYPISSLFV